MSDAITVQADQVAQPETVEQAWEGYGKKNKAGLARSRCLGCKSIWPPNYQHRKCPNCGEKLPRASIPF